jgi:TonB family protein
MIAKRRYAEREVPMPLLPTATRNVTFIFLTAVVLLMSGGATYSQQGHLIPSLPERQYPIKLEVLSSLPDGVNLNPYLDHLYLNIQRNLLARLPESALNGEKGVVVVRVHIEKDGSLPEGAVRIVSGCGEEDMDAAAKSAIRTAAPFGRLPEAYVGSNLDLLFTFGFAPQEPAQKPKVVPVGTAVNHIRQA